MGRFWPSLRVHVRLTTQGAWMFIKE